MIQYNFIYIYIYMLIKSKLNTQSFLKTFRQQSFLNFTTFFFSNLYFTSIYNVHLKIYNSSINNMFTHYIYNDKF